jgi:kynurenine--oxoglutarate transaminase/cysteine-S-conjugate beta-lyase/glutamine--phenylpyruvate transaminase
LIANSIALFATIQAFIGNGDEIILVEPFYDSYPTDTVIAGGIPK